MTVRVRLKDVLLVGVPALLVVVALALHPAYWGADPSTRGGPPALFLVGGTVFLLTTYAFTYTELAHDHFSRSYWHRFQYVKSSPAQAAVTLWLVRWSCMGLAWMFGVLGVLGRFGS